MDGLGCVLVPEPMRYADPEPVVEPRRRCPIAKAFQRPGHQPDGKIVEKLGLENRTDCREPSAEGLQQLGKTLLRRCLH